MEERDLLLIRELCCQLLLLLQLIIGLPALPLASHIVQPRGIAM